MGVELFDYTPENMCDTEQFIHVHVHVHVGSIISCCLTK